MAGKLEVGLGCDDMFYVYLAVWSDICCVDIGRNSFLYISSSLPFHRLKYHMTTQCIHKQYPIAKRKYPIPNLFFRMSNS